MSDESGVFVWLVLEPGGKVMAVLEDNELYALQIGESNRPYGWTVERRRVRERLVEL